MAEQEAIMTVTAGNNRSTSSIINLTDRTLIHSPPMGILHPLPLGILHPMGNTLLHRWKILTIYKFLKVLE